MPGRMCSKNRVPPRGILEGRLPHSARSALTAFGVAAAGALALAAETHAQAVNPNLWITNGPVHAVARSGGKLYIGGQFSRVGPATGSGVQLDSVTAALPPSFPKVVGGINAVIPDGTGGWYIGGVFSSVGGIPRANAARIAPDMSVASWNPAPDGAVQALAKTGTAVFIGGSFANAGGQSRANIAAVDATTGLAISWNPGATDVVRAFAVSDSTLYVGGDFTFIAGGTHNHIAALHTRAGVALPWDPNAGASVSALAVSGSTVYAGGSFVTIGGQSRNRIAALSAATGLATSWDPNANGRVSALAVSGPIVYAGGSFTLIGGGAPNRIAALAATTGAAFSWNPNADGAVLALAVSGPLVYAGGQFSVIGGQARRGLAALNGGMVGGSATSWNPNLDGTVNAVATAPGAIYAGGSFHIVGGLVRNGIAALDIASGAATSWDPNANGEVDAISVSGQTVYAGGLFTHIGGAVRNLLAAIDTNGVATTWNPNPDSVVLAIARVGPTVYFAGKFKSVLGQTRNRAAAVDASTNTLTGWNPNANGPIETLTPGASVLYVGGQFTGIGGQARNNLAALDLANGNATGWNPGASAAVHALGASGSTVYAGGDFLGVGTVIGVTRNHIASFDTSAGNVTTWDPNADGPISSLVASGTLVYVGGSFTNIGGQTRVDLAALRADTTVLLGWNPIVGGDVLKLALDGSTLYAGGVFPAVYAEPQQDLAAIAVAPELFAVTPSTAGDTRIATLTLSGRGFKSGATPKLSRSGQLDIVGSGVSVVPDGLTLTAAFDVRGKARGAWDVTVTNPDGQSASRIGGLSIAAGTASALRVDIIADTLMRAMARTEFDLAIQNQGNVDANDVPVWLAGIPADATVELDSVLAAPPRDPGEPDWSTLDPTLQDASGKYIVLVMRRVPPGVTTRRFYLTVPGSEVFQLRAAVTPPWNQDSTSIRDCLASDGVPLTLPCLRTSLAQIDAYLAAHPEVQAMNGTGVWAKEAWQCEGASSLPVALAKAKQVLDAMVARVEQANPSPEGCNGALVPVWREELAIRSGQAVDPNDKVGMAGQTSPQLILSYSIRFENRPDGIAAQTVRIADPLVDKLDPTTVSFGAISFGNTTLPGRGNVPSYSTSWKLSENLEVVVDVRRDLNQLNWVFSSFDPTTGQPLPFNSTSGFLPPGGQGSVAFTVNPSVSAVSGDVISNTATIAFDRSDGTTTNQTQYLVPALDGTAPTSHVSPLPVYEPVSFTVSWGETNPPPSSDLRDFTIYVSDNGGPYLPWKTNTTATSALFTADPTHVYAFYSSARDRSGNIEAAHPGDTQTSAVLGVGDATPPRLLLEGARPNPARGPIQAWFTLPSQERATLELIDLAGRRVLRREVGGMGAGRHGVSLTGAGRLSPGLYWLRLSQRERVLTARVVVIR